MKQEQQAHKTFRLVFSKDLKKKQLFFSRFFFKVRKLVLGCARVRQIFCR